LKNPVAVGYVYFLRMVHIAEEKLSARGIGAYAKRTLQPLGGRKNKGGQRCGEMETACIIGHDAPINLFEFLTTKSDCIERKNAYIRGFIDEKSEEMITQIKNDLNINDLNYISNFINYDWVEDTISEEYENKLLLLGDWLYVIDESSTERPEDILEDLCYEDKDRELIESLEYEIY